MRVADILKAEIERLESENKIRVIAGCRIYWYENDSGQPCVKAWSGKRSRPDLHYRYLSRKQRWQDVRRYLSAARSAENEKIERSKRQKIEREAMRKKLVVGSIVNTSWGYDQTNVAFFEVVERPSPAMAVIRQIASRHIRATGPMAEMCGPVPGSFVGDPIKRQITGAGVSNCEYGKTGRPCEPDSEHYRSWYA